MELFSNKLRFKENGKTTYLKISRKKFDSEKISKLCQLTEYKVFYIDVYGLGNEIDRLNSDLLTEFKELDTSIKKHDLTVKVDASQMKTVLDIITKYEYDELGIWDTLDRTKNSDSKFWLSYWKCENNYFEIYLHTSTPNIEQIKQILVSWNANHRIVVGVFLFSKLCK
jgi:hypothetical protein